jgi:anthranilate phosphoribosyltransferase
MVENRAMGISQYIKEIGRGKEGARSLTRAQAADLLGQVLDGQVTDLEVGAFCLAMRIKGETPEEMAGFLDATHQRMQRFAASDRPVVVLPSYNGARKLPVLTPLLGLLLAREGLPVLLHGTATEQSRVSAQNVLLALAIAAQQAIKSIANGTLAWCQTEALSPALQRLLEVRRVVGLRNPAHSLVKLMNPVYGPAVVVGSYTHPEYAVSMAAVFSLMGSNALLLRGTEGEPVADPRRLPAMEGFVQGERRPLEEGQKGSLQSLPELPATTDAQATAAYTRAVLAGDLAVPAPVARQVEHILHLVQATEQHTRARGAPAP